MSEPVLVDVSSEVRAAGLMYEVLRVEHLYNHRIEVRLIHAGIRRVLSKDEATKLAHALYDGFTESPEELVARNAELEAENATLEHSLTECAKHAEDLRATNTQLEAKVETLEGELHNTECNLRSEQAYAESKVLRVRELKSEVRALRATAEPNGSESLLKARVRRILLAALDTERMRRNRK